MKRYVPYITALTVIVLPAIAGGFARATMENPGDLLQRMAAAAGTVKSYTAVVHADVAMHTFPYLSPSLEGTYYHKEPSKNKIVFTSNLPFIAKQFSKIYPEVPSPSEWQQIYAITTESDDGTYTTLKLVPRKHGRIDHIDAKVENKTAEVVSMRWNYNDGGYAMLNQTYGDVSGHLLVTNQSGHFETPRYNADLKSTFSNFKIDASIPDSVFEASN
jgi:hypothetical protein